MRDTEGCSDNPPPRKKKQPRQEAIEESPKNCDKYAFLCAHIYLHLILDG